MTTQEIKEKYSNIEDKIPSIWPDYEKAAIELAQDVAAEWDIKDSELIRVLALVDMRIAGMGKPSFNLAKHIYTPFAFAVYPERMKRLNILPDNVSIANALKVVFSQEDFTYVNSGSLKGKTFLTLASIIDGSFTEDFMIFDNAGGKKFDVVINLSDFPSRVKDFTEALKKEHPSWLLAYRIDGKETITKSFTNLFR